MGIWIKGSRDLLILYPLMIAIPTYVVAQVIFGIRVLILNFYLQYWPWIIPPLRKRAKDKVKERILKLRKEIDEINVDLSPYMWAHLGTQRAESEAEVNETEARALLSKADINSIENDEGLSNVLINLYPLRFTRYTIANDSLLVGEIDEKINKFKEMSSDYAERVRQAIRRRDRDLSEKQVLISQFPNEEWAMSNSLGNVMKALDAYPEIRYGIDLPTLWPRLFKVVPTSYRQFINDAGTFLDFAIISSFLSLVGALVALAYGAMRIVNSLSVLDISNLYDLPILGWTILHLAPGVGAIFVAILMYSVSVHAARIYADRVQAAVDLFIKQLLIALDLKAGDWQTEFQSWRDFSALVRLGSKSWRN